MKADDSKSYDDINVTPMVDLYLVLLHHPQLKTPYVHVHVLSHLQQCYGIVQLNHSHLQYHNHLQNTNNDD